MLNGMKMFLLKINHKFSILAPKSKHIKFTYFLCALCIRIPLGFITKKTKQIPSFQNNHLNMQQHFFKAFVLSNPLYHFCMENRAKISYILYGKKDRCFTLFLAAVRSAQQHKSWKKWKKLKRNHSEVFGIIF